MEDNRDYKKVQKFYFTEEGQLVVESNKGVWVDGEQYVKMYGSFVCNAKTMGAIIAKLKGITVEVGNINTYINHNREYYDIKRGADILEEQSYCVLGVDGTRIDEYLTGLAEKKFTNYESEQANKDKEEWRKIAEERDKTLREYRNLMAIISDHNALPWYKRFKKIKY
jgi:hypothetical protein